MIQNFFSWIYIQQIQRHVLQKLHTRMFIEELSVIALNQKIPKCPWTIDWINKYTVAYLHDGMQFNNVDE